jgi:hypothetical protein
MIRNVLNPHEIGFYIIILSTQWMNIMNIRRIEEYKAISGRFLTQYFIPVLEFDTGNNTYSKCNCSDDIINNYYVIIVL